MEASDPDIIKALWPVAEELESDEGFFGHGMIGGSGGANGNVEGCLLYTSPSPRD